MTSDPQIVIQRAVSGSCPTCGMSRRRFYHRGEYIRAGGPDPTTGEMWDADGDASDDLVLCLECGHIERIELPSHNDYADYSDSYADWNDEGDPI